MMMSFYYNYQNALRITLNVITVPLEKSRTSATYYLTKESRQSILVVVAFDAIVQMAYCCYSIGYNVYCVWQVTQPLHVQLAEVIQCVSLTAVREE